MASRVLGNNFKLFTESPDGMGANLIISAHGRQVTFQERKYKQYTQVLPNDVDFWLLAPPNSSLRHEPYADIMRKAAPLVLDMKTHYPHATKHTKNTSIKNMVLSEFKEDESSEDAKIEQAIQAQELYVWDILTIREASWFRSAETMLDDAFKAIFAFCESRPDKRTYNRIIGHFCNVSPGERDDAGIYEMGYQRL